MLSNLSFTVGPGACLKDPTQSELGRKILRESIVLIDEIGLEQFTFRKLATAMQSTEASVYRYFENKHKLLLYLSNWYWCWLQNRILKETYSIKSPYIKLETSIELLATPVLEIEEADYVDAKKLYNIIIAEGPKAYLVKEVDEENNEGVFLAYKGLCAQVAEFITEINPEYKHSHTLASTIIETCHNQIFFSEHLPRLTDVSEDDYESLKEFLIHLAASTIQ